LKEAPSPSALTNGRIAHRSGEVPLDAAVHEVQMLGSMSYIDGFVIPVPIKAAAEGR
jgi:hypothetical protein